mgnify:CR=1 FL=1|jgi:hypothetical protein
MIGMQPKSHPVALVLTVPTIPSVIVAVAVFVTAFVTVVAVTVVLLVAEAEPPDAAGVIPSHMNKTSLTAFWRSAPYCKSVSEVITSWIDKER